MCGYFKNYFLNVFRNYEKMRLIPCLLFKFDTKAMYEIYTIYLATLQPLFLKKCEFC